VGYTPQLVAGVWVGYDQPKPGGRSFTGGLAAAPIWERFMVKALAGKPLVDFPRPDTVVTAVVDARTGFLATDGTADKREEYFLKGTEPTVDGPGAQPQPPAPAPDAPAPETAPGGTAPEPAEPTQTP
jgi:membrane carboxypeptidase/penicillin-binding protein